MRTASSLKLLLLICFAASGCATVIEGTTDRMRYDGGPGQLAFYNSEGKQIPSEHEFDDSEGLHFNFIELDKRESEHVITARFGELMQQDTLRRKFGYGWFVPNALLVYSFPVFTAIDVLTSSIYSFPPPGLRLAKADTSGLPSPILLTLSDAAQRKYDAQKVLVSLHAGLLSPSIGSPILPTSYGITGGYHLGDRIWTTLGYSFSADLEQRVGQASRVYDTKVYAIEATALYNPFKFIYILAGLGFDHMIFQLASRPDDNEKRFGRNVITGSFGGGLYFGALFLEARHNLGLYSIETPEGPGHHVKNTHIRCGVIMRFEWP